MSQTKMTSQKLKLIEDLLSARRDVRETIHSLPPEQRDQPLIGEWSVKDLIAHLIGWDYTNLEAVQEILAGRRPTFFQYYDKDWRSYNAQLVSRYKREPFSDLILAVEASHQELIAFLEACSAEEITQGNARTSSGRTITIRNLLRAEADDERKHALQLRTQILNQPSM